MVKKCLNGGINLQEYYDEALYGDYLRDNPRMSGMGMANFFYYCAKARKFIDKATQNRIAEVNDDVRRCCAEVALEMHAQEQIGGVKQSESIGGYSYSVNGADNPVSALMEICRIWLPRELMYRGAGKC